MSTDQRSDPSGLEPLARSWDDLRELLQNLPLKDRCDIEFVYRRPHPDLLTSQTELEGMVRTMLGQLEASNTFQIDAYSEGGNFPTGTVRVRFRRGTRLEGDHLICGECGLLQSRTNAFCQRCRYRVGPM